MVITTYPLAMSRSSSTASRWLWTSSPLLFLNLSTAVCWCSIHSCRQQEETLPTTVQFQFRVQGVRPGNSHQFRWRKQQRNLNSGLVYRYFDFLSQFFKKKKICGSHTTARTVDRRPQTVDHRPRTKTISFDCVNKQGGPYLKILTGFLSFVFIRFYVLNPVTFSKTCLDFLKSVPHNNFIKVLQQLTARKCIMPRHFFRCHRDIQSQFLKSRDLPNSVTIMKWRETTFSFWRAWQMRNGRNLDRSGTNSVTTRRDFWDQKLSWWCTSFKSLTASLNCINTSTFDSDFSLSLYTRVMSLLLGLTPSSTLVADPDRRSKGALFHLLRQRSCYLPVLCQLVHRSLHSQPLPHCSPLVSTLPSCRLIFTRR